MIKDRDIFKELNRLSKSVVREIRTLRSGTVQRYADFRERVHHDDIAALEAQRDAALHSRKTFNAEYRILFGPTDSMDVGHWRRRLRRG